jgi:PBP4 family serine-type D-alanyl-D-alanine carboxypeptidase
VRAPVAALAHTIDGLLADSTLAGAGSALLVVSLDRGDTLYARETNRLYTPASNRKLFVAATALHYLSPDFRFRTPLIATAESHDDTLNGDLVLIGRGDPDLTTDGLASLADSVLSRGIRVVTGNITVDDGYFDDVEWGPGWMWDDGPYWYWPYINALTLNDNTVSVEVVPGACVGEPVQVELDPPTAYVELNVDAATSPPDAESTLEVERHWTPKENVIDVTGSLPAESEPVVAIRSIEDPALYAGTVLAELLQARGVELLGTVQRSTIEEIAIDTLAIHVSEPLAASVENLLKESDNLTAEQLVKVVGAEVSGPPGTYESGLAAEYLFLANHAGIDTLALKLADGSGVSRYNLVTAGQIMQLLMHMADRADIDEPFLAALPIAGVDGTLEERMVDTSAAGVARAKTGSLAGVSSLSGYVPSANGERLAFSILMEFFVGPTAPRRAIQDSIINALAEFAR